MALHPLPSDDDAFETSMGGDELHAGAHRTPAVERPTSAHESKPLAKWGAAARGFVGAVWPSREWCSSERLPRRPWRDCGPTRGVNQRGSARWLSPGRTLAVLWAGVGARSVEGGSPPIGSQTNTSGCAKGSAGGGVDARALRVHPRRPKPLTGRRRRRCHRTKPAAPTASRDDVAA